MCVYIVYVCVFLGSGSFYLSISLSHTVQCDVCLAQFALLLLLLVLLVLISTGCCVLLKPVWHLAPLSFLLPESVERGENRRVADGARVCFKRGRRRFEQDALWTFIQIQIVFFFFYFYFFSD